MYNSYIPNVAEWAVQSVYLWIPAFDAVPLKKLCCKLSHYSICGYTLKQIESLLTGRSQQVVANGEYSDPITVISRVPQASVLWRLKSAAIWWWHVP